jgi:hypothetical protein
MLQCPTCGHRTFEAGITISACVRITATEDGDYCEQETDSHGRTWHNLQCGRCARYTEEDDARAAFNAATLADCVPDDIYEWFEARFHDYPDQANAGHESCLSIADAWNFRRWQEANGYEPEGAPHAG